MPRKQRSNDKIIADLSDICQGLYESLKSGRINNVRTFSIPLRRLIAEFQQEKLNKNEIDFLNLVSDINLANRISNQFKVYMDWLASLKKIDTSNISTDDEEIGLLLLEIYLPIRWTVEEDFIFIDSSSKHKNALIKELINIGQQHIFELENTNLFDSYSGEKLELKTLSTFLKKSKKIVGSELQIIKDKDAKQDEQFVKDLTTVLSNINVSRNTIVKFEDLWNKNQLDGYFNRLAGQSQQSLERIIDGQDVLIISPGPSLKFAIKHLQNAIKDTFLTIAVAQSMPALNAHGITPDFIMVSDPTDFSSVLKDTKNLHNIAFIGDESVHENFLKKGFQSIFTITSVRDIYGLSAAFDCEQIILMGGTVSLRACDLSLKCGARTITLIGQDLAFKEENYFVSNEALTTIKISRNKETKAELTQKNFDKSKAPIEVTEWNKFPIEVRDWNGDVIYTKSDYHLYLTEFEKFAESNQEKQLFNCSEGGAFIEGFQHKSFKEHLQNLKNNSKRDIVTPDRNICDKKIKLASIFLKENVKVLNKFIFQCKKIQKELSSKNINEKNLIKIDRFEKKLISLSKKNKGIGNFFVIAQIDLREQLNYVKSLDDNLNVSKQFYMKMGKDLVKYKNGCIYLESKILEKWTDHQ